MAARLRYCALLVGAALCVATVTTPRAAGRVWTNDEGKTLEAELVRLRGDTAILRTEDGTVPAPIDRLSDEDKKWVERYKELTPSREWGKPGGESYRGEFLSLRSGKVRVRWGSKLSLVPYEELSAEDWRAVRAALKHLEEEPPEDFLALKPVEPLRLGEALEPAEAVQRTWTDARGKAIEAGYLGTDGPRVVLWMNDKEYRVPLSRFSEADQAWVAKRNLGKLSGDFRSAFSAMGQLAAGAAMAAAQNGQAPPRSAPAPPRGRPTPRTAEPPGSTRTSGDRAITDVRGRMNPGAPTGAERFQAPTPPPAPSIATSAPADEPDPEPPEEATPPAPTRRVRIGQLSTEEKHASLEQAFGADYFDGGFRVVGLAECSACNNAFGYPDNYVSGDPCPFCSTAVVNLSPYGAPTANAASTATTSGGVTTLRFSRPWYTRRWFRSLVVCVVLGVVGGVAKMATGGGD